MKLQGKLAVYNTVSKFLITALIFLYLPKLIEQVIDRHVDQRLYAKKDKVLALIKRGGLSEITKDEDCSFGNYTLLKQEYVSVEPLNQWTKVSKIEETRRQIENDIIRFRVLSFSFLYDNQYYLLEVGEGMLPIDELNQAIRGFSLKLIVFILLISILLDIGFTRVILQPFHLIINRKLRSFSHPIGADVSPIPSSTWDFRYLDTSINELMEKVKAAFLIEKEFIANASHELLTPISILNNKLENLLQDESLSNSVAEKIVDAQNVLNRLSKIIKALLLISKVENEQYLKTENLNLNDLLNEVIEDTQDRLHDRNIKIDFDFDANYSLQKANRSLLYTMLSNLLSNAIKYNKEGGKVLVSLYSLQNRIHLKISDTGTGIDKNMLPSIFDRFKRFHHDQEGYGLGLPIVKTIARFHQITLSVESEVQHGTTFILQFPFNS